MLSIVNSLALQGIDAQIIKVEVDVSNGLPGFDIVGVASIAVRESRERVKTAIKNSGFEYPIKRITVNLAPADLKKEGTGFDLPIAIGILAATGQLAEIAENMFFIGEMSLDGTIREVPGVLPMSYKLSKEVKNAVFFVPNQNGIEASIIKENSTYAIKSLKEVVDFLQEKSTLPVMQADYQDFIAGKNYTEDFSDVIGQHYAKRGLEIVAAGGHNALLYGTPGSGKSMIAKRLITILPDLDLSESLEISKIYSTAGLLNQELPLITKRPFRSPHHSASTPSLIGGGRIPKPGDVSLASGGVLYLDEVAEFKRDALEALRQPLEDRQVTIARVNAVLTYPANFILVGSFNPCPCGYYSNGEDNKCTCTPYQIQKYRNKLSGPLLDRIDIQIEMLPVKYSELQERKKEESSATIKARVIKAREIQKKRLFRHQLNYNAEMNSKLLRKYCSIDAESKELLKTAFEKMKLSMRGYDKVLKVARTIADLAGKEHIEFEDIAEALQFRIADRNI